MTKQAKLSVIRTIYPDAKWRIRNGRKTSYIEFVDRQGYYNLIYVDDLLGAMIERGELVNK
jgi:hypothetical protein